MVGVFYCIVYEVVYIIWESTVTFRIQYIGSLYQVVYFIPVTAYTSIRLYEYPLIRVSAYTSICLTAPSLPENILFWLWLQWLTIKNTLAYCDTELRMAVKSFTVQADGVDIIKHFFPSSQTMRQNKPECLSGNFFSLA